MSAMLASKEGSHERKVLSDLADQLREYMQINEERMQKMKNDLWFQFQEEGGMC